MLPIPERRPDYRWSLSGADEDDFTIRQSGGLEFASAPDYETPTDSGGNNTYISGERAGSGRN